MGYIVKGNLSASLSLDFIEAVSNARVRIYRVENEQQKNSAKSKNKREVYFLTNKEISEKEPCLIGKGKTDIEGNFEIELSNAYKDGPIVIDLKISGLPGQKKTKNKPVQFSVRKLRPIWRAENENLQYSWNYSFPFEFWSRIRNTFDAWTIYGCVKSSENDLIPISGATVAAFDDDWIKDDMLGHGSTDSKGYFRIDFDSSDFKRTFLSPLIKIETPISTMSGPGVYFKVTADNGSVIYEEDRTEGRSEERKHIPRCYSVDLNLSDPKNKAVSKNN